MFTSKAYESRFPKLIKRTRFVDISRCSKTMYWQHDPNSSRKANIICLHLGLFVFNVFEGPKTDVLGFEIVLTGNNTYNSTDIWWDRIVTFTITQ